MPNGSWSWAADSEMGGRTMQCVRRQKAIWGRKARPAMAIIVFLLLSGTCFASEPVPMQELLQRTGKLVEDFVSQLSGVRCKESVNQVKLDRKSTRLNSSHGYISYAVFCLKKKK